VIRLPLRGPIAAISSSAATISSGQTPSAGSSKTTSIETDGSILGSPSGSGQCTSYSVKPVPRCPQRRVNAIRTASTIAVFPVLFGPMKTVVSSNSRSRDRIERKFRIRSLEICMGHFEAAPSRHFRLRVPRIQRNSDASFKYILVCVATFGGMIDVELSSFAPVPMADIG